MSQPPQRPATERRPRALILALAVFDVLLLLLPPVHWLVRGGHAVVGLGYFLVSGALVVASLFAIAVLDRRLEA